METKAEVWIPLTQGKVAVIDFDDFEKVRGIKWYAWQDSQNENGTWYARRNIGPHGNQKTLSLHRFLTGEIPGKETLHIDGDGLNCRQSNLTLGTGLQNRRGKRSRPSHFLSPFRGVSRAPSGKWRARIGVTGAKTRSSPRVGLGYFNSEIDAAKAYDAAALKYFGADAALNFPAQKENQCQSSINAGGAA